MRAFGRVRKPCAVGPAFAIHNRGFTLIEVIGVLSIMAIMASVIAPSVLDDIKRARQDQETKNLAAFGEQLQRFVLDTKSIPKRTTAEWTAAIASVSTLPREKVEFNEKGFRRGYYVDPKFLSSSEVAFPGYTQNAGLTSAPVSPRIMLISSLTQHVAAAPTNSKDFNDIWDQTSQAKLVESPDVKIERMNFSALFEKVILSNASTNQPGYRLESGAVNSMPAASGGSDGIITRWVIRNTQVSLYGEPYPSGSLDRVFLADEATDYAFELVGTDWVWQRP